MIAEYIIEIISESVDDSCVQLEQSFGQFKFKFKNSNFIYVTKTYTKMHENNAKKKKKKKKMQENNRKIHDKTKGHTTVKHVCPMDDGRVELKRNTQMTDRLW